MDIKNFNQIKKCKLEKIEMNEMKKFVIKTNYTVKKKC